MDIGGLVQADRDVEGVVEMMLDATGNYKERLTEERLFAWHASLFPTGRSGMTKITVGAWRDDDRGPMQVVSGPMGRETIHYQAPAASRLPECSQDTAYRDIMDLVKRGALEKDPGGGRSTSYSLAHHD